MMIGREARYDEPELFELLLSFSAKSLQNDASLPIWRALCVMRLHRASDPVSQSGTLNPLCYAMISVQQKLSVAAIPVADPIQRTAVNMYVSTTNFLQKS